MQRLTLKSDLPIDSSIPTIIQILERDSHCVIRAAPGAGKSTRVPPALLQVIPQNKKILMLQPRRIAVKSIADRIAAENNWVLDHEIGTIIRFERKISKDSRIIVMTEGVLLNWILRDPELKDIGLVILDEFHERSIHLDLSLALLREIHQSLRPDLKIVVMSATLDSEPVSQFLGKAPVIDVPGKMFPIKTIHTRAPRVWSDTDEIVATVCAAVKEFVTPQSDNNTDSTLVFLPGEKEIRKCAEDLKLFCDQKKFNLIELYGNLGIEAQEKALDPRTERKIILATNIAETSLTIPGIARVIDSGLARIQKESPETGLARLELTRISKASAEQRRGRAGRIKEGQCIRLWTLADHHFLPDVATPEIHRVDLAQPLLFLKEWGVPDLHSFQWYEKPDSARIEKSFHLLNILSLLQTSQTQTKITPLGKMCAHLPVHPRLALILILGKRFNMLQDAALACAILQEKDFSTKYEKKPSGLESDVLDRVDSLRSIIHTRHPIIRLHEQLQHIMNSRELNEEDFKSLLLEMNQPTLEKILLRAYPDRVTMRRASGSQECVMGSNIGLSLHPASQVVSSRWFISAHIQGEKIFLASAIDPTWILELFPDLVEKKINAYFDHEKDRVLSFEAQTYMGLEISSRSPKETAPSKREEILLPLLHERTDQLMKQNPKLNELRARFQRLLNFEKSDISWDSIFQQALQLSISQHATLNSIMNSNIENDIAELIPYSLKKKLDKELPTHFKVPSGSLIPISYTNGEIPVLSVRLQEIFGLQETPRLCSGQIPILIELLAPNFRPVQTTQDLKNFWNKTYHDVRKELRARYPKHSWPENPFEAVAVAKGRHQKK